SSNIAYLSDENGIVNRYVAHLDSAISFVDTSEHYRLIVHTFPQTNYARNILSQDINNKRNRLSEIVYYKGRLRMYVDSIPPTTFSQSTLPNTIFRNEYARATPASPSQPAIRSDENQKVVIENTTENKT